MVLFLTPGMTLIYLLLSIRCNFIFFSIPDFQELFCIKIQQIKKKAKIMSAEKYILLVPIFFLDFPKK